MLMLLALLLLRGIGAATGDGRSSTQTESTPGGPAGWTELANTKIRPVCPPNGFGGAVSLDGAPYPFASYCRSVTDSWNSAILDVRRNRLLLWAAGTATIGETKATR